MNDKETAIIAIRDRIATVREELSLNTFVRNPTIVVNSDMCPAVFMIESTDEITKPSSRGMSQFPAKRYAEVLVELVVDTEGTTTDHTSVIKSMYLTIRNAILIDPHPIKDAEGNSDTSVIIVEGRTEGPLGYGIPGLLGMRLVLGLTYTDKG